MIVGVVLAAGLGTRFRAVGEKVLHIHGGRALVRHAVDRLEAAGVKRIIVVTGECHVRVAEALEGSAASAERNPAPEEGLAGSLRVAVQALPGGCEAFVVVLADQPFFDPAVVRELVAEWERTHPPAVVPRYDDADWGHPLLIDATMAPLLLGARGDTGARPILQSLGGRVARVAVAAPAPADVDEVADLGRLPDPGPAS